MHTPLNILVFKTSDGNNIHTIFSLVCIVSDSYNHSHKGWGWHFICINVL